MAPKPKTELADCAQALLKISLSTPIEEMDRIIEQGYLHLAELKKLSECNPIKAASLGPLVYRLERAEKIRDAKVEAVLKSEKEERERKQKLETEHS